MKIARVKMLMGAPAEAATAGDLRTVAQRFEAAPLVLNHDWDWLAESVIARMLKLLDSD